MKTVDLSRLDLSHANTNVHIFFVFYPQPRLTHFFRAVLIHLECYTHVDVVCVHAKERARLRADAFCA